MASEQPVSHLHHCKANFLSPGCGMRTPSCLGGDCTLSMAHGKCHFSKINGIVGLGHLPGTPHSSAPAAVPSKHAGSCLAPLQTTPSGSRVLYTQHHQAQRARVKVGIWAAGQGQPPARRKAGTGSPSPKAFPVLPLKTRGYRCVWEVRGAQPGHPV